MELERNLEEKESQLVSLQEEKQMDGRQLDGVKRR